MRQYISVSCNVTVSFNIPSDVPSCVFRAIACSDVPYDTEASKRVSSTRRHNSSRSSVLERVLFLENHVINEKRSLTFCPITCGVGMFETPDLTLQASFHSDLFNYIFKYPVIQII